MKQILVFATDIIDGQRQQLEDKAISMESALAKANNGLFEARKEVTNDMIVLCFPLLFISELGIDTFLFSLRLCQFL